MSLSKINESINEVVNSSLADTESKSVTSAKASQPVEFQRIKQKKQERKNATQTLTQFVKVHCHPLNSNLPPSEPTENSLDFSLMAKEASERLTKRTGLDY